MKAFGKPLAGKKLPGGGAAAAQITLPGPPMIPLSV
jgi:hypothetical protein